MADRTNKPNRIFSMSGLVCSSLEPHRAEHFRSCAFSVYFQTEQGVSDSEAFEQNKPEPALFGKPILI